MVSNSTPVPEGTVIMAETQTAGRGQRQNKWYSQTGESLTFSLLLNPDFLPIDAQFDLNRAISLGVQDALLPVLGEGMRIKWPNDIYCNDRKLGGILIENQVQGNRIRNSITGIGLNVNQSDFPDWVPNGVSVKQILQTDYELRALLSQLCNHIERWYVKLREGETSLIREQYLQHLYRFKTPAKFGAGGKVFEGTITGVTDGGLLEVAQQGKTVLYDLKGIEFIND